MHAKKSKNIFNKQAQKFADMRNNSRFTYRINQTSEKMTTATSSKKLTIATVKSFIKKNRENLFVNVKSSFDGMTDGIEQLHKGFQRAKPDTTQPIMSEQYNDATQGIEGVWFTGSTKNYIETYNENGLTGFQVSNCCGRFIVAIETVAILN